MRITNGMIAGKYSRNLNSAISALDYYNNRATTLRRFDKFQRTQFQQQRLFALEGVL